MTFTTSRTQSKQHSLNICKGTTRWVVLTSRYAIKLPSLSSWEMFLRGLLGNMQETVFATMRLPQLCPIRCSLPGGLCLVMRRAEVVSVHDWYDTVLPFVRANYAYLPASFEYKRSSFGWLDGRLVIVDFGD